MVKKLSIKLLAFSFILSLCAVLVPQRALAASSNIMITELQTGGSSATQEFVELFNSSNSDINVTGWKVVYASASNASSSTLATLDGLLSARGYLLLGSSTFVPPQGVTVDVQFSGGMAAAGGHIRVVDSSNQVLDTVGWGTAVAPEAVAVLAPPSSQSLHRLVSDGGNYIDTDNNAQDFAVVNPPTPEGGWLAELPPAPDPVISIPNCNNVAITEIMPNPAGTDTGHEFIEIFNPTGEVISLFGCKLSTSANTKVYSFAADAALAPGEYLALYDSVTGLTLTNAAGGTVKLTTSSGDVLVSYPENMGDNFTWIQINGAWQISDNSTPSEINQPASSPEIVVGGKGALGPCPAGKYRNPETNRCKTLAVATALAACPAGKFRNPETNRCKSFVAAAASLKPCQPGQTRNPATNRCRRIDSASGLKPCEPGQARNPATNRCRKVAAASVTNPLANAASATTTPKVSYPVLLLVTLAAAGYGLYEYRPELANLWARIRRNK